MSCAERDGLTPGEDAETPRAAEEARAPLVVHVATVAQSLFFLRGQVSFLRERGFAVRAISSPGRMLDDFEREEDAVVQAIAMTRRITPLADAVALVRLFTTLRRLRADVVHAHTPKAGLLAMIAAYAAGTPVRIYHLRGLPHVTARGARRLLLRLTDRLSCLLAHRVLAVSHSTRNIAVHDGLCPSGKIAVLASGSGNGVDAAGRFRPLGGTVRRETRARYGLPEDALVVGYVGRLVREKGVAELARAWRSIRDRDPGLHLLLVGRIEDEDPLPAGLLDELRRDPRVRLTGVVLATAPLYAAMDLVALPTYREGFPNVPLEAAAMELPVVGTDVPGCVDAIEDGVTGLLVPARDEAALAEALLRYIDDPELRARHGAAGRARVLEHFRPEGIWEAIAGEYEVLLARSGHAPRDVSPAVSAVRTGRA